MIRACLIFLLLLASSRPAPAQDDFVWPGHGVPADRPVWGHREGLRIGLAPAPGPQGLLRIYAPYLGQEYPRMVNFLSVEPAVKGEPGRGQSELEASRERPGERGLTFHPSNRLQQLQPPDGLPSGMFDADAGTLRLFVHPEPFRNGAKPILELVFHRDQPHEVEIVTHAAAGSAAMESCVISATMGNYGLLRRLHLAEGRIERASQLWSDEPLDHLGFLPWRTWPAEQLQRTPEGGYRVCLTSDFDQPSQAAYDPGVPAHWRYRGDGAAHCWRAEAGTDPSVAVNGRLQYWQTDAPIPGGACFENFELRLPFRDGNRLWFSVEPTVP